MKMKKRPTILNVLSKLKAPKSLIQPEKSLISLIIE